MSSIRVLALASSISASFVSASALAEEADTSSRPGGTSAFQLSVWSSLQTSSPTDSIHGLRLNLPYGKNHEVHGLDLGIANHTTEDVYGAQFGLGGYAEGDLRGLQSHLVSSIAKGEVMGVQEAIYTSAGKLWGVQAGVVNHVEDEARGARFAAVNLSDTYTEGAELGVVNYARRVRGLQLGLVNVTGELHGVQIGLANFAKNGFLPFFPVVNAAM